MVPGTFASSAPSGADAVATMLAPPYSSWWAEYSSRGTTIGPGSYAGCIVLNNATVNAPTVKNATIRALLAANSAALPVPNMNNIFVLFFRSDQTIKVGQQDSITNFCAYHDWMDSSAPGVTLNYVVMPNESNFSGCSYASPYGSTARPNPFNDMTAVLSHEIAETVTDPNGNAWTDPNLGPSFGYEIGDLCAEGSTISRAVASASSGQNYQFQFLYSNHAKACLAGPIAATSPTISNLPSPGTLGATFAASIVTNGDGATYLIANSPAVCSVSGLVVTLKSVGSCSLTAAVATGTTLLGTVGVAQTFPVAPPPAPILVPPAGSVLRTNGSLTEGQSLVSSTGYRAVLQTDGNFVIYSPTGRPLWADGVNNFYGPNYLVVQADGNLVDYLWNGRPLWSTRTSGANAFLVLQPDGNLVLYSGTRPLWATGT
jgi:hypothetical protein